MSGDWKWRCEGGEKDGEWGGERENAKETAERGWRRPGPGPPLTLGQERGGVEQEKKQG